MPHMWPLELLQGRVVTLYGAYLLRGKKSFGIWEFELREDAGEYREISGRIVDDVPCHVSSFRLVSGEGRFGESRGVARARFVSRILAVVKPHEVRCGPSSGLEGLCGGRFRP